MRTILPATAIALISACSGSPDYHQGSASTTAQIDAIGGEEVDEFGINALRARSGLAPLNRAPALDSAASAHARDMAQGAFFAHTSSNGDTVMSRVQKQGYGACLVAENIAWGHSSLGKVLEGWMSSPGHRANILSKGASEYGLAHLPAASGSRPLWVMVVAKPGC